MITYQSNRELDDDAEVADIVQAKANAPGRSPRLEGKVPEAEGQDQELTAKGPRTEGHEVGPGDSWRDAPGDLASALLGDRGRGSRAWADRDPRVRLLTTWRLDLRKRARALGRRANLDWSALERARAQLTVRLRALAKDLRAKRLAPEEAEQRFDAAKCEYEALAANLDLAAKVDQLAGRLGEVTAAADQQPEREAEMLDLARRLRAATGAARQEISGAAFVAHPDIGLQMDTLTGEVKNVESRARLGAMAAATAAARQDPKSGLAPAYAADVERLLPLLRDLSDALADALAKAQERPGEALDLTAANQRRLAVLGAPLATPSLGRITANFKGEMSENNLTGYAYTLGVSVSALDEDVANKLALAKLETVAEPDHIISLAQSRQILTAIYDKNADQVQVKFMNMESYAKARKYHGGGRIGGTSGGFHENGTAYLNTGFYDDPNKNPGAGLSPTGQRLSAESKAQAQAPLGQSNILHELMHSQANPTWTRAVPHALNEGVTQYLTEEAVHAHVRAHPGFDRAPSKAYVGETLVARALVDRLGRDGHALVMAAFFEGEVEPLIEALDETATNAPGATGAPASLWRALCDHLLGHRYVKARRLLTER